MWFATLGSRGSEHRPVVIEGGALCHRQFGWERKTFTNGTGTVMEQGASKCLAQAFRSERGKSIQAGLEGWKATRGWRDGQCCLVYGKAMCQSGWHSQFGTS